MSCVKYNLKISHCNILTYINTGPEWESDWRAGKPSAASQAEIFHHTSFTKLNMCFVQILLILPGLVWLITPHFTALGRFIISQELVVFSSQEEPEVRCHLEYVSSGLLVLVLTQPMMTCVLEKGISDLGQKSEIMFCSLKSDVAVATGEVLMSLPSMLPGLFLDGTTKS